MSTAAPSTRAWQIVLSRLGLDIVIGITLSASIWVLSHALHGDLVEAIKGNVEDALSQLQGFVNMGVVAGAVVGLVHGLATVQIRNRTNGDQG
jgi:hypothetical protein